MEIHHDDSSSQTNTVLIVIVLVLIVGFGVWWFTARNNSLPNDNSGIKVDVNLPKGDNSSSGDTNGGTTTP